ncbi:MAG TPA: GNAT family N-acetyltransferase [Actinomycetota bacterium]|nr:GNAT family N-acetyltransferase [Actinomycetota bacterium]
MTNSDSPQSKPSPSFRPATREDVPRIAAIHVAGWNAAYKGRIDDQALAERTVDKRIELWNEVFDGGDRFRDHEVHVAEDSGAIVGFTQFGPSDDDDVDQATTVNVYALYLDPELRGRGLGRGLLDHVVARARAAGAKLATLYVLVGNDEASSFYERVGWEPEPGVVKECLGDGYEAPQSRWRKALS